MSTAIILCGILLIAAILANDLLQAWTEADARLERQRQYRKSI